MIFVNGLKHPEAPLLTDDGGWMVAEMGMGDGGIVKVDAQGNVKTWVTTGRPNGLLSAGESGVWVAESWNPSLLKVLPNGKKDSVITGCGGQPFLWPNDLVYGPDGFIYLTDSGITVNELIMENDALNMEAWLGPMNGCLYRINPHTLTSECLDQGFRFINGIAFGPDEKLYVSETVTGNIYRYNYDRGVVVGSRELFVSALGEGGGKLLSGPDGMAFDCKGNLYVAVLGQSRVAVVSPSGKIERSIVTQGQCPTNVAFGPKGRQAIYVTEFNEGCLEMFPVPHDGFAGYSIRQ